MSTWIVQKCIREVKGKECMLKGGNVEGIWISTDMEENMWHIWICVGTKRENILEERSQN
jgi:hypothetical protein